ncbi:MAG: 50S ribosomal protein L11 [Candidatus Tyloplasma litorale]|nr:MAG: 50S ribosomal protein L11 [Mycoplasmatales bacterium]
MAKKLTRVAKLQFVAGKSKPGPELAGLGIDMVGFTREFNDATRDRGDDIVPVVITAYSDRSYSFVLKTSPASNMLLKAAGIKKGASKAPGEIVGSVTEEQLKEIAEYKLDDLNTNSIEAAVSMLKGTAKNMGISVEETQVAQSETNMKGDKNE